MKITEITEGWGEYSNKSNHRMNKLKRKGDLEEGEFGQWLDTKATQGANAMSGAIGRQAKDMATGIAAKLGSGKAKGAQQMQRVVGGVIKNFNRYLGQTNGKPTMATLKQYLTALGFQNVTTEAVPSQAQIAQAQANKDAGGKAGRKDSDVLDRNELFNIVSRHIQQALKTGTLPKQLQKVLG